ncbi:uncharacterized protein [Sinocyclocheilus grahami]|uniref:uncharacterized protein n=1 Tax=Sinocyclocheilus grahami TaxID=75366 RepID=UPI0007ACB83D|nr:PREDICTED: uncharacterized protein LOC107568426 [Sinocyclocheilus grahami]
MHPNCTMKKIVTEGKPHLCLFALRDIVPGEEITYDYGGSVWPWRKGDAIMTAIENCSGAPVRVPHITHEPLVDYSSSEDEVLCSKATTSFKRTRPANHDDSGDLFNSEHSSAGSEDDNTDIKDNGRWTRTPSAISEQHPTSAKTFKRAINVRARQKIVEHAEVFDSSEDELSEVSEDEYIPDTSEESSDKLRTAVTQRAPRAMTHPQFLKVPVLVTPSMQESIRLLIENRNGCGVPNENSFLFARPFALTFYRGSDCIREFAVACNAKNPQTLTSTKLRKQIGTLSEVLNLSNTELDQLADFLGHDIRVHRQFYRLPEGTLQLAKMSKIFLALEKGRLADFKGRSFDEIDIDPEEEVTVDSDLEDTNSNLKADECRKRWKSLRDTYRRERRKESERNRSGAGASSVRPWRYSGVMGFLNPFIEDRITASNMVGGVGEALTPEEREDAMAGHSQAAQTTHSQQCEVNQLGESLSLQVQEVPTSPSQSSIHVQAGPSSPSQSSVQGETGHSNRRKRAHTSTEFEERMLTAL